MGGVDHDQRSFPFQVPSGDRQPLQHARDFGHAEAFVPSDHRFDTPGAARHLGLHPDSLRRLRTTGKGPPYVRFGKHAVRYRLADLDEWMAAGMVRSTAAELAKAMAQR